MPKGKNKGKSQGEKGEWVAKTRQRLQAEDHEEELEEGRITAERWMKAEENATEKFWLSGASRPDEAAQWLNSMPPGVLARERIEEQAGAASSSSSAARAFRQTADDVLVASPDRPDDTQYGEHLRPDADDLGQFRGSEQVRKPFRGDREGSVAGTPGRGRDVHAGEEEGAR